MSRIGLRRLSVGLVALVVAAVALVAAIVMQGSSSPTAMPRVEAGEFPPAMAKKMAAAKTFAPPGSSGGYQEGDRTAEDDAWMAHAIPGTDIPSAAMAGSRSAWASVHGRSGHSGRKWKPLGPTWGKSLPNPFRDRAVYNAGTPDFSGRTAHTVIDPDCGSRGKGHDDDDDDENNGNGGSCRLWIANANGGVWRTNNALAKQPKWKYVSEEFEHNSVSSLELDPNEKNNNTIWAGTGESNACGSGCEAGVGMYKSKNGGNSWSGPYGGGATGPFYNRAVASIAVKPGNSNTMFAATGRAIRGLTSACCGGVDAIIPGAPHFGLWRSLDGGQNWTLVNQGANVLCTGVSPDVVALSGTVCSARGARRVYIDPVDPNTVYAGFFGRGIWRSRANGDIGSWEQIMAPVTSVPLTPGGGTERPEFDVVRLANGETRMYVGVGGGAGAAARFRRNDNVRSAPAAAVLGSWVTLTSFVQDTPGYSSANYCDGQCSYDNYVFAPAHKFPNSGADADTVYLVGDNEYSENDWGPLSPRFQGSTTGRSNGRGIVVSTNAGVHFTDMTDDASDQYYPVELHPDHHALTVNPRNWKQFFEVGDGGIQRSNGNFVDDSGDCVNPKGYTGTRLVFCQLVLSRIPERLKTLNKGLRTLHFYQLDYSPFDPSTIVGGTQDNGSWERGDAEGSGTNPGNRPAGYSFDFPPAAVSEFPTNRDCLGRGRGDDDDNDDNGNRGSGGEQVWVNVNIADGGHNGFDIGDPCFRLSGFQQGQTMVTYDPKNQVDMNWTSDTHFVFYGGELNAFIGTANDDRVHPHWLWSARQHVFRSMNQGRNPVMTKQQHRIHCNVWYGDGDVDENGVYQPLLDICDDWKPLGDPGPNGRLTAVTPAYGATKSGGYTGVVEPAMDGHTFWAATQFGRVFVSKNADDPNPAAVVFDRIDDDPTAANSPARFVSAIWVDENDPNHAWVVYSGFNAKDTAHPGHVFEVRYIPGASTFTALDGDQPRDQMGDIPATSVSVSPGGTVYVGTDYGCVATKGDGSWRPCGSGLPNMPVADLIYVREKKKLYAATHGQGVWELKVDDVEKKDD